MSGVTNGNRTNDRQSQWRVTAFVARMCVSLTLLVAFRAARVAPLARMRLTHRFMLEREGGVGDWTGETMRASACRGRRSATVPVRHPYACSSVQGRHRRSHARRCSWWQMPLLAASMAPPAIDLASPVCLRQQCVAVHLCCAVSAVCVVSSSVGAIARWLGCCDTPHCAALHCTALTECTWGLKPTSQQRGSTRRKKGDNQTTNKDM